MANDWLIGAFTLAGTLGGTALGGFISSRIQRDAENRREAREAAAAEAAMLAAKRQVAGEIHSMTIALHAIATGDDDAAFRHLLDRRELWDQYGPVLAHDDSYMTVNRAYAIAEMVHRNYDTMGLGQRKSEAADALTAAQQAYNVLDPDRRLRRVIVGQEPEHE